MHQNKYDKLLILRGVLCLIVFFGHIHIPNHDYWWLFFNGRFAVTVFFILSGCLISTGFLSDKYQFTSKGIQHFYTNRLRRIAPTYYFISLVLLFFTQYRNNLVFHPSGFYKVLSIFTFTFNNSQLPLFTGSWWSISLEMQFYLIAPLVCFLILKLANSRQKLVVCSALILICGMLFRHFQSKYGYISNEPLKIFLENIDSCILGCFIPLYLKYFIFRKRKHTTLVVLTIFVFTIFLSNLLKYGVLVSHLKLPTILFFAQGIQNIVGCLVVGVLYEKTQNTTFTQPKSIGSLFHNIGIISLGFYLWHSDVQSKLQTIIPIVDMPSYVLSALLGVCISLILASLTWLLLDMNLFKNHNRLSNNDKIRASLSDNPTKFLS